MGVIRNTASMQIRGRVGNTTYYVEGGRQIARVSQNGSNYGESASRTEKQQFQRGKWGNLVNFYKVSKSWMKKAYESKSRTQSDYNRFMQLNTPNARIYLTKNMYANGGCVADEFRISEGSLRPIDVVKVGAQYRTSLNVGDLEMNDALGLDVFSDYILENNSFLREGMQISFISYQQTLTPDGVPSLVCTAYEVTIDTLSGDRLRDYLPIFCSQNVGGYLGTSNQISTGAFAYVLSETRNGKTSVSTQTLITKNANLIDEFSSEDAIARSIASYGVDEDIFLTSGSYPKQATEQPIFIDALLAGSGGDVTFYINAGDLAQTFSIIWGAGSNPQLVVSGRYTSVDSVTLVADDGKTYNIAASKEANNNIYLGSMPTGSGNKKLIRVDAVLDGKTISIEFTNE